MMRKLKQNKGETLMEALMSLLIAVLAIGLVATAAMAATNINKNTNIADDAFAEELEKAEIYTATTIEVKKLTIDFGGGSTVEVNVDVYVGGSRFASYK
jgi:hypothetical protein